MMKEYKWQYDRLTALTVAFLNCIFVAYVLIRMTTDNYFLYTQTGIHFTGSPLIKLIISLLVIALTIWLNLRFIRKQHHARLFVGMFQTVGLACILRNIFVGFSYFGFGKYIYMKNVFAFLLVATLIYHTLFSKNIRTYFEEA